MTLKSLLRSAALATLVCTSCLTAVRAQTQQTPADQQNVAPEEAQQNFGPRVNGGGDAGGDGGAEPAPPPTKKIGTFGDWQVQCSDIPAQGDQPASKQCGMVQITQSEKDKEVGLSLIMVFANQGGKKTPMMRVMVPTGVYLPTGVALEIDGAAVGRVPFTRCLPQICEAFAEASPETLAKMKKGATATFIIYEAPGLGIPMKINLKDFQQGLDVLAKQ